MKYQEDRDYEALTHMQKDVRPLGIVYLNDMVRGHINADVRFDFGAGSCGCIITIMQEDLLLLTCAYVCAGGCVCVPWH